MTDYEPSKYPSFIRVNPEDVTLKFVFDNIRNIGLSALVCAGGIIVTKGEPISSLLSIPYTQMALGLFICLGGFLLAILNFLQGVLAILATKKFNIPAYLIFAFILHIASFEVFFKQVIKLLSR